MERFTNDQLAAAAIASKIAEIVVLQQWMTRDEAKRADQEIKVLRQRQLDIETAIEMAD